MFSALDTAKVFSALLHSTSEAGRGIFSLRLGLTRSRIANFRERKGGRKHCVGWGEGGGGASRVEWMRYDSEAEML